MSVLNYDENLKPAVTVVCITYKHEEYIRQALDSFLMQKTNFSYQIFVGEDKGPDSTADIVREYAEKYPDKIVAFLREENMGAQRNLIDMCKKAKSPYIAFCEGDDFWIDEYKLQKQYDLMEAHPEYRACFAETEILADESWYLNKYYKPYKGIRSIPRSIPGYKRKSEMKMDYYIGFGPAHTSSMFFRWNYELEIPEWYYRHIYGDHSIMMLQVGDGLLGYIPDIMSVYRRSDVGVLMNDDIVEHFINTRESWIEMAMDLEQHFRENYGDFANEAIKKRIELEYINYIKYLLKRGCRDKFAEAFQKYVYAAELSMNSLIEDRTQMKKIEKAIKTDNMEMFFSKLPLIKSLVRKYRKEKDEKICNARKAIIKHFSKYAKVRKQPNLWVFTCEDHKFINNTRHFYEYVIANHPEINAVWFSNNTTLEKVFLAENLPYVRAYTKEAKKTLKHASVIFVNQYVKNSCIYNGYNSGTKIVRLSYDLGYIDNMIDKVYDSEKGDFTDSVSEFDKLAGNDLLYERYTDTALFVVPNGKSADRLKDIFGLEDKQLLVCNSPRSAATRTMVREGNVPLILYKIAERKNRVHAEKVFEYLANNIPAINEHAQNNNYVMHIHLSELDNNMFGDSLRQQTKEYSNIIIVYGDAYTNLSCYDAMITDFDSSAMDFILQDKPVISLCNDITISSEYKNMKYEYTKTISSKVNTRWDEVFADIEEALGNKDYQKEFRNIARQYLFDDTSLDYCSSEKIVAEVKKIIGM